MIKTLIKFLLFPTLKAEKFLLFPTLGWKFLLFPTFLTSPTTFNPVDFLPPAAVGWGKVIVSVCLSVHTQRGTLAKVDTPPPPPASQGGYPPSHVRYPLTKVGTPRQGRYTPPPPPRACYTAAGMPLAFTQEDFLVQILF